MLDEGPRNIVGKKTPTQLVGHNVQRPTCPSHLLQAQSRDTCRLTLFRMLFGNNCEIMLLDTYSNTRKCISTQHNMPKQRRAVPYEMVDEGDDALPTYRAIVPSS